MLSVIGVVIAIALALLCLGIVLQYWMVIAAVVVGTLFLGPIGGIVGFFLGVFIKGSINNSLEDGRQPRQNDANNQQTHQQHSDYTQHQSTESGITIQSLVPIIQLISYFCLKKDKQWTSEKVRFVKEIFEDACETQADFQLLQQLMKSKNDNEYGLVQQFIAMQPDYELRHKVFIHCGIALLLDDYSNSAIDSILSQLGQQLYLEKRDYTEAINRWKNESNQQQYSNDNSHDSTSQHSTSQHQLAWAYGILGLDHYASEVDVKKAFRQKMAQYHPDKNQNVTEAVQQLLNEKTVEVQKARDVIMSSF